MPRPSQTHEKRKKLLPIVARAFAELGYRRATTAELAQRCKVRENILYRLWPHKKAMFIASIDYVYEQAAGTWRKVLSETDDNAGAAVRLLKHEGEHYGESGLHRIIFAGLSETDDRAGAAVRLLTHEAEHYGESGLHRIIFAGLSEADEPEIREALRKMYGRFHRFIRGQIAAHRDGRPAGGLPDEAVSAWAIVGLGNVANIGR